MVGGVGVDELEGTGAEDLEAVVEVLRGCEGLGAKAGGGVIKLDQGDGVGGLVDEVGFDVGGVAAGEQESRDTDKDWGMTHERSG